MKLRGEMLRQMLDLESQVQEAREFDISVRANFESNEFSSYYDHVHQFNQQTASLTCALCFRSRYQ